MTDWPAVTALGDAALLVTFADALSDEANDRVIALAASLRASPLSPAVRDIVPAMTALAVHVDPAGARIDALADALRARAIAAARTAGAPGVVHEIPVEYGGARGPDLADVAAFAGCSAADVIERHANATYRVYMLGFLPGFAYLGPVDPAIAAPRRSTPRQAVPAGSVGIAGSQTGIYPQRSPGGWQLVGHTSLEMFDAVEGRARLQPGDRVRFVAT